MTWPISNARLNATGSFLWMYLRLRSEKKISKQSKFKYSRFCVQILHVYSRKKSCYFIASCLRWFLLLFVIFVFTFLRFASLSFAEFQCHKTGTFSPHKSFCWKNFLLFLSSYSFSLIFFFNSIVWVYVCLIYLIRKNSIFMSRIIFFNKLQNFLDNKLNTIKKFCLLIWNMSWSHVTNMKRNTCVKWITT